MSQLNRSVESRGADGGDKRPQLSDLRESGAIEQDADIVCFIHRPEYYLHSDTDAEGRDIRGLALFIVAKHRSGSVDDVKMRFRHHFARFENWTESSSSISKGTVGSKLNGGGGDVVAKASVDGEINTADPFEGTSPALPKDDVPF